MHKLRAKALFINQFLCIHSEGFMSVLAFNDLSTYVHSICSLSIFTSPPPDKAVPFDKLMESSLSHLSDSSQPAHSRTAFKFTQPSTAASHGSAAKKTYSPSTKARVWTADASSLEGVFAQHSQVLPQAPQPMNPQQEDDFGEFYTSPTNMFPPHGATGVGQEVQAAPSHGGNLTMANPRPVPATSISGFTKEGYSSSDAMQQRTHTSYSVQAKSHPPSSTSSGVDASKFPPVYLEVYKRCVQSGEIYLSTELLFPILLSSQLPKDVLRDLWSRVNRGVPGKLNQMELFVLLGLIGLVQVSVQNLFVCLFVLSK